MFCDLMKLLLWSWPDVRNFNAYCYVPKAGHSSREVWGINVFARLNNGIVGSNPAQGIDVCLRLFCLCCVGSAGHGSWAV
jgi:hypothetical protein